ncbi:MAG: hypothetical protein IT374_05395 [Polyangiaceae bacterium]|nr:hypothetical protein [Polyangiaceae bacterium]
MTGRRVVALALALAACGRSELEAPTVELLAGRARARPDAGRIDAGADAGVIDAGMPAGSCPDAVLAGAPAPISAYCSTRAYESAFTAPTATALLWSVTLSGSTSPDDTVILAPSGRAFVRVDPNETDTAWLPTRVVAIDPGGAVAFERDVDGVINGAPWLDAGGALGLLVVKPPARTMLALDQAGATLRAVSFDEPLRGQPAIGPDGATYFLVDDGTSPARVLALSPTGERLWTSSPLGQSPRQVAMDRAGRVIVGSRKGPLDSTGSRVVVTALGGDGAIAWETEVTEHGHLIDGPSVGPDGASYTVIWSDGSTKTTLVVLEPTGATRRVVDVGAAPWGGGVTGLSVGGDGAAYVKAGQELTAIDAAGSVRWSRFAHPNVLLGCTIDASGAVIVSSGKLEVLDPVTGAVRSTYDGPPMQGSPIFAVGGATLGDGAYYFTDFGKTLYAVGAP